MYVSESIDDLFKPKSEEEINNHLNKKLRIEDLQRKLKQNKGLFVLYIYDDSLTINFYLKNINNILKIFKYYASEALKDKFFRKLIIYKLNYQEITDNNGGDFSDEGSDSYGVGAVKIISKLIIKGSNNIEIEL